MNSRMKSRAAALLATLALWGTAQAGRPCETRLPEASSVQRALGLAERMAQALGEFFLDDLFECKAGIAVLRPDVQAHLLPLLRDNQRVTQLHQAAYNMVAYPWSTTYQQSNQWAIETLALAEEPGADTRERAQAWLAFKGYAPTTLRLSAMTRLGARMTAANVAFDDHPNDKRFSDRIETVTVDSVFAWLQRSGLAGRVQEVR